MQLVRRHLVPPELDHELIWLTVSFGSLAFAAIWLALGLPWPRCAFHDVTGCPCATCAHRKIQFCRKNFCPRVGLNFSCSKLGLSAAALAQFLNCRAFL